MTTRTYTTDGPAARAVIHIHNQRAAARSPWRVQGMCRTPAATPTRDTGSGSDPATRKLVAQFKGSAYIAEREGEELNVYLITSGPIASATSGDPPASTVTGDWMTAAKFQARVEASRGAP